MQHLHQKWHCSVNAIIVYNTGYSILFYFYTSYMKHKEKTIQANSNICIHYTYTFQLRFSISVQHVYN